MNGTYKSFQISEKVGFLHESGRGVVTAILPSNKNLVLDDDGFENEYRSDELIKLFQSDKKIEDVILKDDQGFPKINNSKKKSKQSKSRRIIDLHIEELVDDHSTWSNDQILNYQLKALRNFFNKAKNERIRKLIVIHGVGEGVLKEEVLAYFTKIDGVLIQEADFREFGKGATEIQLLFTQMEE